MDDDCFGILDDEKVKRYFELCCGDKNIETITHGLEPIAPIIRADYDEPGIQFFTPGSFSQQI